MAERKKTSSPPREGATLSERKREDILRAAAEAFRHDGVRGASTDAIAERAGVSKRTLYNHFASKDALFDAVIERYWRRFAVKFEAEIDASLPLEARVIALCNSRLEVLLDPELVGFFRAVLGESVRTPELVRAFGHEVDALEMLGLESFVREEHARGRLVFDRADGATIAASQLWNLCINPLFWSSALLLRPKGNKGERDQSVREGAKTFLARYASASKKPSKE